MITKPGIYALTAEEYHRDPCPDPSLSSSLIAPLLITPRHAWTQHPRFGNMGKEADSKMDFGTVAHRLLLGKGRDIVIVDAKDWRTKAAQSMRDLARERGQVAILREEAIEAERMAIAARQQLEMIDDCFDAFTNIVAPLDGVITFDGLPRGPEKVIVWQESTIDGCDPIWCRSMIDWLPARRETGHIVIYDLKTTDIIVTPESAGAYLCGQGYDVQLAFYERGLEAIFGDAAGLVVGRFVIQNRKPPYMLIVAELEPAALMIGRKKVAYAIELFRRCSYEGDWPGFPTKIVRAEMPSWHESRWLAREMAEDGDPANDPFLVGSRWIPPEPVKPLVLE